MFHSCIHFDAVYFQEDEIEFEITKVKDQDINKND